ncbi:MAG: AAA family ATPase [Anaerolineae bacterium]|nr:AAA family ATPase [Anaerolineae bacterium]
MNCPTCDTDNRQGAAFCRQCGSLLLPACPGCGAAAAVDANFCDRCGRPLAPRAWTGVRFSASPPVSSRSAGLPEDSLGTPAAPPTLGSASLDRFIPRELLTKLTAARGAAAERRVVTMLFCDIQGSTALAEQLDPEEWTEIVNSAFEQMIRPVYKYEGTVARLMGDGLLAFFGAPMAHEDDPRRAVLAGLAIVDGIRSWRETQPAAARQLDVRVGINTGLVVVGAVGSDLRLEYSAIGDAINLAARMEQTAAPGTVRIAEDTYRLVADQFELEPLGDVDVKGKTQPVMAYRVLRRIGLNNRRATTTVRSALVNRRKEWEAIEQAFHSIERGRGSIVFLIGDAGLGKTRLLDEAIERLLPEISAASRFYSIAAVSYEASQPFGLLLRLMRAPLGLMPDDPPALIRQRVAALVADEDDRRVLETLFGVAGTTNGQGLAGEQFTHQLGECLDRFWRAQAAGPLVITLDELQWLDSSSAGRLAPLFALSEDTPLLFLCALRRERHAAGWRLMETAGRDLPHRLSEIALHPLNDMESRQLIAGLLNSADLPDTLVTHILEKAEGNPLFVEEVVRHLMERGVLNRDASGAWGVSSLTDVALPDSLQALLTARIDRLDEATRRTLQIAAIFGRHFTRSPLAALVEDPDALDRHLSELQRMELVYETGRVPEPGYSFSHNLIQEAVYQTILLKQRRALHRRVAEVIEALPADNPTAAASVLAQHFIEADAPGKALPHLLTAAGGALRLHATAEALALYERATPIALNGDGNADQLIEIYTNRGRVLELESRFAEAKALYEAFDLLAQSRSNADMELEALIAQGKLYGNVTPFFDPARGRELMERARTLAESAGNRVAEVRILWNLVNADRFDINSLEAAVVNGEKAIDLARQLELGEELAYLLNDVGEIYGTLGRFHESAVYLGEAQERWRQLGNDPMLADSLSSLAVWLHIAGHIHEALDNSEEAVRVTTRIGNLWGEGYSLSVRGEILGWLGEFGQAIEDMVAGHKKTCEAGFIAGQLLSASFLSRVFQELGEMDEARRWAQDALRVGRDQLPQFVGLSIGRLASVLMAQGEVDAAAALLTDPQALEEQQQLFMWYDISRAQIELALARAAWVEATALARQAVKRFEEWGCNLWLPDMWCLEATALRAGGRLDEAAGQMNLAIDLARTLDMRGVLWRYLGRAGEIERERGREAEAQAREVAAAAEIDYLATRIYPPGLLDTFLRRSRVANVV